MDVSIAAVVAAMADSACFIVSYALTGYQASRTCSDLIQRQWDDVTRGRMGGTFGPGGAVSLAPG
jgi:hypothetical protein